MPASAVDSHTVQIAGAGPSGLAAAITLARGGRHVIVHEAQREVGYRFQRDLQGLENWSSEQDVLVELAAWGLTTKFAAVPCRNGTAFDAWNRAYPVQSTEPLFYMVERGPGPASLDTALLNQARELGVEVRFNSRLQSLTGSGVLAVGPKAADVIAVGYHFDTSMDDGFWAICDDELAPSGYAYLLVMGGKGTIKTCLFRDFKRERMYVERTLERFKSLLAPDMRNLRNHGGVGNVHLPETAYAGTHAMVGEQAGFQTALWGFGMRVALASGVLAARSILNGSDYDAAWRATLDQRLRGSLVNRAVYGVLGNRGYRFGLRFQAKRDARVLLNRVSRWGIAKQLLEPWARRRWNSVRRDHSCDHVACECIWCRCGGILIEP